MKKLLTAILLGSCVLLMPNSILAKETNTEVSSNKITSQELEAYLERMVNEWMEKYNATDGTAILYDNRGNVIHTFKTITREDN
ncbi:hypothetical protein AMS59_21110 [Lysinibacillus sp. FJAT-14745]|uniref:hypothetical protein n=1 Tax=Lysinibacillus sp. FJAT-14745 TaxID=1704289 RepID=UPI0006ABC466|nr:hypothetical protein [Lysinibacillus sp. FJAT-14745]KOP70319.1 hypothetical protein AMS59_21110 [Lysinibacillus sp. FJAT-14745]